jgi:hypothetical protein
MKTNGHEFFASRSHRISSRRQLRYVPFVPLILIRGHGRGAESGVMPPHSQSALCTRMSAPIRPFAVSPFQSSFAYSLLSFVSISGLLCSLA